MPNTTNQTPTYAELLAAVEEVVDRCEDLPEATLDCEALLRTQIANHLASAIQALNALTADESEGAFRHE